MKRHLEAVLAFCLITALAVVALYGLIVPVRWGGQR
jgi:hypothetical protein